ncbi:uncharacterized protein BO80DRAFT_147620 [Aspergillus ibericus CBS 121593]|uniref:Uncharacterized protein n=1 Tax=Aspergillus ibericus CBS 121593 TaxID=1448316 RepID=A0A395GXS9_9EURO|nr:hypothetical protein BO80DRAFT_147620 [Aspergillus ibericus CBS 121593]RAK98863.1 hypothetical protein BO80DRAFT_147620 [Aspergillus ibericus CBS 121593]
MSSKHSLFDRILRVLESGLDTTGAWKQAQKLRRLQQTRQGGLDAQELETISILLANDFSRRMNIQYEGMFLQRRSAILAELDCAMKKKVVCDLDDELNVVELNLKELEKYMKAVDKTYHSVLRTEGDKPFERAIKAHWKRKKWQLSKWLKDECAARGGCCARGCGCCKKQRSQARPGFVGHCTFACACCEEARGYEVENYEAMDIGHTHQTLVKGNSRGKALIKAYVWGL